MHFAILPKLVVLVAIAQVGFGHVRLTFPPARQPDYDFLDNLRTGGPCGVPGKAGSFVMTVTHAGLVHCS